jgi:diamine N-acetyltransferase
MLSFGSKHIYLRALEPEDLSFLEQIENDEQLWHLSNTQTPFSKDILKKYLENGHRDIFDVKQLRLVICHNQTQTQYGFVDIYDFSPKHKRAGLGIIIDAQYRGKGYAREAIQSVLRYGFDHLDLHQFYAFIELSNHKSLKLFESCGFKKTGERKDWNYHHKQFHTEAIYQNINNVH